MRFLRSVHTAIAPDVVRARLTRIARITPTVKEFELECGERAADGAAGGAAGAAHAADLGDHDASPGAPLPPFRAGQWVDFKAPGVDVVGGFSLTSTAQSLPRILLAVKNSAFPPVKWLHEEARPNQSSA